MDADPQMTHVEIDAKRIRKSTRNFNDFCADRPATLHEPLALIYARKKEQVLFKLLFDFRPKRARKLFSYTVRLVM